MQAPQPAACPGSQTKPLGQPPSMSGSHGVAHTASSHMELAQSESSSQGAPSDASPGRPARHSPVPHTPTASPSHRKPVGQATARGARPSQASVHTPPVVSCAQRPLRQSRSSTQGAPSTSPVGTPTTHAPVTASQRSSSSQSSWRMQPAVPRGSHTLASQAQPRGQPVTAQSAGAPARGYRSQMPSKSSCSRMGRPPRYRNHITERASWEWPKP